MSEDQEDQQLSEERNDAIASGDDEEEEDASLIPFEEDDPEDTAERETDSSLRRRRNLAWSASLTIIFEGVTCLFRFGLNLQSTRDTQGLSRFTFGLRIHHGYLGIVLLLVACRLSRPRVQDWFVRVGWALIASDLTHHFLVLWPVTGSPQFDFFYPDDGDDDN